VSGTCSDGAAGFFGDVIDRRGQGRGAGAVFMEHAQARDAHGGQVLGNLVDLVTQAGAHAVHVRHVGADFSGAVTHQGDLFLFQNARLDQLGNAAVAKEARQRNGLALGQDLGGGCDGVIRPAAVILAHQTESVAARPASLVGIAESQLSPTGQWPPDPTGVRPGQ
jgi:hypothetical protein